MKRRVFIKGLLLSNDNHLIAKKMLEDRFGDPQILISSHMSKLLSLETISEIADVKGLRHLYDEVETQVRSLSGFGLDPRNYGLMLTPILFSKIPDEFKLVISRKFGKTLWDIDKILEFYNLELEAREKVKFENTNGNLLETAVTGSALFTSSSRRYENGGFNSENRFSSKRPENRRINVEDRFGSKPRGKFGNKFEKCDVNNACVFLWPKSLLED